MQRIFQQLCFGSGLECDPFLCVVRSALSGRVSGGKRAGHGARHDIASAQALLQIRADPNKPDKGGQTALHHATKARPRRARVAGPHRAG